LVQISYPKIKRGSISALYTIKNITELVSELNSGASIRSDVTAYTQHVNGIKG
jgi:hypothetical protein